MRIIFFGTPYYVVPVLEKLHKTFKSKSGDSPIVAVVTQKPKPAGRKKLLEYSAVDKWAHNKKIPIYFTAQDIVDKNIKADIGVLVSYGEIISKDVINHFPNKILNVHPSLLPKFRGASPVQSTIVSSEMQTGATIIQLDEEMDHGPIVGQFKEEVKTDDTTESLRNRLFEKSANVLTTLIPAYVSGKVKPREQDHDNATYSRQIKKQDAFIPPEYVESAMTGSNLVTKGAWEIPFVKDLGIQPTPSAIHNFIRAMLPWPVAWTHVKLAASSSQATAKRLRLQKSSVDGSQNAERLNLLEVQLEGKTPVSWHQFTQGYPNFTFNIR